MESDVSLPGHVSCEDDGFSKNMSNQLKGNNDLEDVHTPTNSAKQAIFYLPQDEDDHLEPRDSTNDDKGANSTSKHGCKPTGNLLKASSLQDLRSASPVTYTCNTALCVYLVSTMTVIFSFVRQPKRFSKEQAFPNVFFQKIYMFRLIAVERNRKDESYARVICALFCFRLM